MFGVVVTGHAKYSTGLQSTLKLVGGEMENIRYCDFLEGYSSHDISFEIQKALDQLSDYEGIFILADIMGGTPFNQSVLLTQGRADVKVLGGVNFAMLYSAATAEGTIEEALETILEEAKSAIGYFGEEENALQEDKSFDGI